MLISRTQILFAPRVPTRKRCPGKKFCFACARGTLRRAADIPCNSKIIARTRYCKRPLERTPHRVSCQLEFDSRLDCQQDNNCTHAHNTFVSVPSDARWTHVRIIKEGKEMTDFGRNFFQGVRRYENNRVAGDKCNTFALLQDTWLLTNDGDLISGFQHTYTPLCLGPQQRRSDWLRFSPRPIRTRGNITLRLARLAKILLYLCFE